MVRKRITHNGKRYVVYSRKREAQIAKDKAPGKNTIRKITHEGKTYYINKRK